MSDVESSAVTSVH